MRRATSARRRALRRDELGDVIQCDDVMALIGFADSSRVTRTLRLRSRPARLMVTCPESAVTAEACGREQIDQLRHHLGERMTSTSARCGHQLLAERLRMLIRPGIHADDAGTAPASTASVNGAAVMRSLRA